MAWRIGGRRPNRPKPSSNAQHNPGSSGTRLSAVLADTAPLRGSPAFRRLWLSQLCSGFGAIAVGGVTTSVFSGTFTRLPRPGTVMLVGSTVWGVSLLTLGLVSNAWLGLGCLALAGAADTLAVVSRSTVVQLNTPDEMLGRVAAAEQIAGQAGPELGNLRAGLTAAATSGSTALVSGGVLCLAALAVIVVKTPQLREFTHSTTVEQPPQPVGAA